MRPECIQRADALLLVVDVQERLAPAIDQGAAAIANVRRLLGAAGRLAVPVMVSEQYVRGLGATLGELLPLPAGAERFEKIHFSCTSEPGFLDRLAAQKRRQIVVCGMEAHVCVLQTVLGLLAAGYAVFLVADASGSRTPANHGAALARAQAAGAAIVTSEMVLFEWLGQAATDDFRAVLPLIK